MQKRFYFVLAKVFHSGGGGKRKRIWGFDWKIFFFLSDCTILFCIIGYLYPYLLVYTEQHIDVYNANTGEWIQTLNLRKAKPLTTDGALTMCQIQDSPYTVVLSSLLSGMLL